MNITYQLLKEAIIKAYPEEMKSDAELRAQSVGQILGLWSTTKSRHQSIELNRDILLDAFKQSTGNGLGNYAIRLTALTLNNI